MPEPDFAFVVRQLDGLISDVGSMRDELRVQGAMILRLDASMMTLLEEMRATHTQMTE
jgi:hypothetical protein